MASCFKNPIINLQHKLVALTDLRCTKLTAIIIRYKCMDYFAIALDEYSQSTDGSRKLS